jgi:hypothetical protein
MKSIVSKFNVLIWLSILSAHFSQETTPLKHLTDFTNDEPTLQHRVVKRQSNGENTPTPEDRAICNAKLKDALCTAGIEQGSAQAVLNCNRSSIEKAQKAANSCAKGEDGQFCGSLLALHRPRVDYIAGNCTRLNSCPSNCRSLLKEFRSTLGCCINAYVNGTGLYSRAISLDYQVWNLCNVPLPPTACGNVPTINTGSVQNCTNEDFFNMYYVENLCLPKRRQAYIDILKRLGTGTCGDTIPSDIENTCAVDTNGIPCGALYYQSLEDLARLHSACSTSGTNCTSNCSEGIIAAKNRYGCCFRSAWFNISISTTGTPSYLSSSVLQSCDIDLPGACEGLIGSAVSIMKENCITVIITGLVCLQLIMTA